jgi:hypothetical protein
MEKRVPPGELLIAEEIAELKAVELHLTESVPWPRVMKMAIMEKRSDLGAMNGQM